MINHIMEAIGLAHPFIVPFLVVDLLIILAEISFVSLSISLFLSFSDKILIFGWKKNNFSNPTKLKFEPEKGLKSKLKRHRPETEILEWVCRKKNSPKLFRKKSTSLFFLALIGCRVVKRFLSGRSNYHRDQFHPPPLALLCFMASWEGRGKSVCVCVHANSIESERERERERERWNSWADWWSVLLLLIFILATIVLFFVFILFSCSNFFSAKSSKFGFRQTAVPPWRDRSWTLFPRGASCLDQPKGWSEILSQSDARWRWNEPGLGFKGPGPKLKLAEKLSRALLLG